MSNYHKPVYVQTLISEGQLVSPEFGLHLRRASDLDAPPAAEQDGVATIANGGEVSTETLYVGLVLTLSHWRVDYHRWSR